MSRTTEGTVITGMNKCSTCIHYGEKCDVTKTPPDSWCDKYEKKEKECQPTKSS